MNATSTLLTDLQHKLGELFKTSPASDIERNLRAVIAQGMHKLEFATQEDMAEQRAVLAAAQARLKVLEERISALEARQV